MLIRLATDESIVNYLNSVTFWEKIATNERIYNEKSCWENFILAKFDFGQNGEVKESKII